MQRRNFLLNLSLGSAFALAGNVTTSSVWSKNTESSLIPNRPANLKKIRIAQIGVRHDHASGKMNDLRLLSDWFEIVGIATESSEWESKLKNNPVWRDLKWMKQEEILSIPDLDAVAVETEVSELLPTALRCAERNLSIHIDKPLGCDLEQCRNLLKICQKKDLVIQPGYMFRGNPAVNFAVDTVRSGMLGEICDIVVDMNKYEINPKYRQDLASYKGGAMFNIGCHILDIIVDLLGAPSEITVFERKVLNDGLSDNMLTVLTYPKAIAQARVSFHDVTGFEDRRLFIAGTKGSLELRPMETGYNGNRNVAVLPLKVRLALKENKEKRIIEFAPPAGRYTNQLIDFAKFIRKEKKNPYSYEHELLVQKVVLAASGYFSWNGKTDGPIHLQ